MTAPLRVTILTLFPKLIESYLSTSILGRAQSKKKVVYEVIDIRQFAQDKHQTVDDRPFGGGVGMVLKGDVLSRCWQSVQKTRSTITILTSAAGKPFKQADAQRLTTAQHLIIVCGHYEGVDQRFIDSYVNEEISIGDFVLTGGELPALVITDAIVRLVPGVLEKEEATVNESFTNKLLEHPQYTRPAEYDGQKVPEVLISGNHEQIKKWRQERAETKTKQVRPDLKAD